MIWLNMAINIVWSLIALVPILIALFVFIPGLGRRFRVRHEREHHLNIHHKANFRAFYYLAVEAPPQPALRFCVMAGNIPLAEISQPAVDARVRVAPPTPTAKATEKPVKTASVASPTSSQPFQQQALEGTSKAVAKTGTVANSLGALAGLLPGSLGDNARKAQEGVRHGQVVTAKAVQAPKQAQQRISVLQSESQKLGGSTPEAKQTPPVAAKQKSAATVTSQPINIEMDQIDEFSDESTYTSQHPFGGLYCVQTFELDPEQTLPLKLLISPATGRLPLGSYAYTVYLQAVPLEQLQEEISVVSRRGTVHYAPVAAWRSFMPGFIGLLLSLIGLLIWFYLLAFIWR